jgi:hypothetical protein
LERVWFGLLTLRSSELKIPASLLWHARPPGYGQNLINRIPARLASITREFRYGIQGGIKPGIGLRLT